MGFFQELKENLSIAVNELIPDESIVGEVKTKDRLEDIPEKKVDYREREYRKEEKNSSEDAVVSVKSKRPSTEEALFDLDKSEEMDFLDEFLSKQEMVENSLDRYVEELSAEAGEDSLQETWEEPVADEIVEETLQEDAFEGKIEEAFEEEDEADAETLRTMPSAKREIEIPAFLQNMREQKATSLMDEPSYENKVESLDDFFASSVAMHAEKDTIEAEKEISEVRSIVENETALEEIISDVSYNLEEIEQDNIDGNVETEETDQETETTEEIETIEETGSIEETETIEEIETIEETGSIEEIETIEEIEETEAIEDEKIVERVTLEETIEATLEEIETVDEEIEEQVEEEIEEQVDEEAEEFSDTSLEDNASVEGIEEEPQEEIQQEENEQEVEASETVNEEKATIVEEEIVEEALEETEEAQLEEAVTVESMAVMQDMIEDAQLVEGESATEVEPIDETSVEAGVLASQEKNNNEEMGGVKKMEEFMTMEEQETTEEVQGVRESVVENKSTNSWGFERIMDAEARMQASDETAVITAGMKVHGDITSQGSMDVIGVIDGNIDILGKLNITGTVVGNSRATEIFADGARITGEVCSDGSVKIGQSSVIIGNITATSAVIAGAVKGDIDVKGPVILDTSAIVMGNIKSKSVQINNGAVIEGMCSQCYAEVSPTNFFNEFKK